MREYTELTVRSHFSFLQAASSPEQLVRRAAELNYKTFCLSDRDGLYGIVRAYEACEENKLRLVVGCELTVEEGANTSSLFVYVENHQGYENLCQLLTKSHARYPKGAPRKNSARSNVPKNCHAGLLIDDLLQHSNGLWLTASVENIAHLERNSLWSELKSAFQHKLSVRIFRAFDGSDLIREQNAQKISKEFNLPIVATHDVFYAQKHQKPLFDVMYCIREGLTLNDAGRALALNSESHLKPQNEIYALFSDNEKWVSRADEISDACRFSLKELEYRFPSELSIFNETPDQALRRLTEKGIGIRYPNGLPDKVRAQVEKELNLIAKRNVAPFFLTVHDVVEIARSKDILCQGRGSAANSAVCFCLGITAVDPARSNLLFERFLSMERQEPPDIDVDFEHERREEVIQALYEKYGRERAAMVSEVICYRGKLSLREVGKVFGFSLPQVDKLAHLVSWWESSDDIDDTKLQAQGFDVHDGRIKHVLSLAHALQGAPRHLSIHVGGFVLSAEPLSKIAPVEPATMKGRTVVPWDKDDIDTLGFFKMDVLSLGMLSAVRKALAYSQDDERLKASTAIEQLAKIPAEDSRVYEELCKANTVGVFQIESRAQMSMLPRLKPKCFYDLVVEVALVRPGPIQGGMVHPYLRRRAKEESADSPHPILEPILSRTLGVPIFQEQVMQIAIDGAGYSGGEADQLRRDMAAWRKTGNLERHKDKLKSGFLARGISEEFADRLYEQMKGFADYGFPESHAASFALLVYASAWLKVHHPAEFAAALINSQPMGFYTPNTILEDAKRHGVEILPLCIERSTWDCGLEILSSKKKAIRLGFRLIKGFREECAHNIERARKTRSFVSVKDVADRSFANEKEMSALAAAGAFHLLHAQRREAVWHVRNPGPEILFEKSPTPETPARFRALNVWEEVTLDYSHLGTSTKSHPMKWLRSQLPKNTLSSREFSDARNAQWAKTAGLVICRQRPQTASGIVFLTLEDEFGFINWVVHNDTFEKFRDVATTSSFLLGKGVIDKSESVVHLIVRSIERVSIDLSTFANMSRDFH